MCNVYGPAGPRMVTERFHAQLRLPAETWKPGLGHWGRGPFVRLRDGRREAVVGQWALIRRHGPAAGLAQRQVAFEARGEARVVASDAGLAQLW